MAARGRGIFRPRARYFPGMESTQRSSGQRPRTRGARLENGLNLFGAGMNLGPFRSPPAAARAGQIRRPFFPHIAPLVRLAFSAPLDLFCASRRGRPMWRPAERRARRPGAPQERTYSRRRSPHPPQRARWGTFPQGKALRAATGRPCGSRFISLVGAACGRPGVIGGLPPIHLKRVGWVGF